MLFLLYGRETLIWREKERSRIRIVQMDNLRDLLGIKRMDRLPNAQIRDARNDGREWIDEKCSLMLRPY